jgi:hypothetical protein
MDAGIKNMIQEKNILGFIVTRRDEREVFVID